MSTKEEANKHTVIFVTREELSTPSTVVLPEPEKPAGLILEDGSINWDCPCLGGMVAGPCGVPFREAFSCFHYSEAEPKGSNCMEAFSKMQDCMHKYPKLYGPSENDEDLFGLEQSEKENIETGRGGIGSSNSKVGSGDHKTEDVNESIKHDISSGDKKLEKKE